VEYATFEEASEAIKDMNGQEIMEKHVSVDWAFQEKPLIEAKKR
jgi:RNA recognition motif-containing protein